MNSDVLAPLNSYQERRRSNYRPKRHKRNTSSQGSSSALLPQPPQPLGPISPSPPESPIDMAELDPRLSWPHDPNSLLTIPTPSSNYNRSDSLLNRIFPPSEVGSIDGRSRFDTESAYSLPSIVSADGGPKPTGDRRNHVHEHIYHPTASAHALHTPWTADVLHPDLDSPTEERRLSAKPSSEFGEPPPLPEKDFNYNPPFKRPGARRFKTSHNSKTRESGASLPSLPEDTQFALAPMPPYPGVMKNDTARSSTLVDSVPASPQSAYFSESHRPLSYNDEYRTTPGVGGTPPLYVYGNTTTLSAHNNSSGHHRAEADRRPTKTPHDGKRPVRKQLKQPPSGSGYTPSIASTRPASAASAALSAMSGPSMAADDPPHQHQRRHQRPAHQEQLQDRPPPPTFSQYLAPPSSGHRREKAMKSRALDEDSDDDDDQLSDSVSVNTFYTAASSQPRSAKPSSRRT